MKKTIALAAIVMVAVVMGISTFAPAAMAKGNVNNGEVICHRGGVTNETPEGTEWVVMSVKDKAVPGHLKHGDWGIDNGDTTVLLCETVDLDFPQPPPQP